MRTILLTIEYDGTRYAGWQFQANSLSVQGVVEAALTQILGSPVRIHSSGRTDAGVHARGMAAHFRTEAKLPLSAFREGANRFLPQDVVIRQVREVDGTFHARYSARGKWYRYSIYRGATRSPLATRTAWHRRGKLDLDTLRAAASLLVGEHDFRAFRTSGCMARTTRRTIYAVDLTVDGEMLHLDFRGSGFLRNMVRMLVGTLIEVAGGKRPVADVSRLLAGDLEVPCGPTAPSQGLCLQEVWYDLDGGIDNAQTGPKSAANRDAKNSAAVSDSP